MFLINGGMKLRAFIHIMFFSRRNKDVLFYTVYFYLATSSITSIAASSKSTTVVTNYLLAVYNLFGVEQEVNSGFIRVMTQNIKVAGHNAEKNKLKDNKILI